MAECPRKGAVTGASEGARRLDGPGRRCLPGWRPVPENRYGSERWGEAPPKGARGTARQATTAPQRTDNRQPTTDDTTTAPSRSAERSRSISRTFRRVGRGPGEHRAMAVVEIPGSKSITARALFLAAAADGVTTLVRPLRSDDTEGFAEGLAASATGSAATAGAVADRRPPAGPGDHDADVHCRDGATDRPVPAHARRRRPRHLPLRRLRPDAPPPPRPPHPGPARPGRGPAARGAGGPPPAERRRGDGMEGRRVDPGRRSVLAVPDRAAAARSADPRRACASPSPASSRCPTWRSPSR